MAAVTTFPGLGAPVSPRRAPTRVPTPRIRRPSPATYRRRRLAAVGLALGLVVVAAQAGAALGGAPLAAPERRPASSELGRTVVVRPGDTLWDIAVRLAPDEDPRPAVDAVSSARDGAPLVPGEVIRWPG
jgi:hypothetical protein